MTEQKYQGFIIDWNLQSCRATNRAKPEISKREALFGLTNNQTKLFNAEVFSENLVLRSNFTRKIAPSDPSLKPRDLNQVVLPK